MSRLTESVPPAREFLQIIFRPPLRESRFWLVQALVLAVTAFHGAVEWIEEDRGLDGFLEGVHQLPIAAYIIPILLGGLWYGLRGAILTGALSIALSFPNLILFHRTDFAWVGESLTNVLSVGAGLVVASVVERNAVLRGRAEADRSRLRTLREVTGEMSRHEDDAEMVAHVLERMVAAMPVDAAGLVFAGEEPHGIVSVGDVDGRARLEAMAPEIVGGPGRDRGDAAVQEFEVVTAERNLGTLLVVCNGGYSAADDSVVLSMVAGELAAALEMRAHRVERQVRLREYVRAVTVAQERERKRIARDLHDGPTQWMIAINRLLGRLEQQVASCGHDSSVADELRELVGASTQSLRRTIRALRPPVLDDFGLVAALQSLVDRRSATGRLSIDFDVSGQQRRLESEVELAAYRIAQEALTNAERHGATDEAHVRLEFTADGCLLEVADRGRGFDTGAVISDDQFGIVGMSERADLVGGRLNVDSEPGVGTTVTLHVP